MLVFVAGVGFIKVVAMVTASLWVVRGAMFDIALVAVSICSEVGVVVSLVLVSGSVVVVDSVAVSVLGFWSAVTLKSRTFSS